MTAYSSKDDLSGNLFSNAFNIFRFRRDVFLHLGFSGILILDSCQKFGWRKCHNLTLGEILQISCDNIVGMDRFRSCTLNGILEIFPFHIHSSFQNCRTEICKFKNQIQLTKHFLNLIWSVLHPFYCFYYHFTSLFIKGNTIKHHLVATIIFQIFRISSTLDLFNCLFTGFLQSIRFF